MRAVGRGAYGRLMPPRKSAKRLRDLTLTGDDEPDFRETYGYHNYGDPWKEQRYTGD